MKKYISLAMTLVLTLTMLFAMVVPASAEITNTFVDEIPADTANFKPEVVEFSNTEPDAAGKNYHRIAVEANLELGKTLLLKASDPRDAKHTEYIVYKMDKDICGFKLDVFCCAGLGNPLEDISVYLSKDGSSWNQINTQATKYVYDEDIYINFDKAYWHNSTITNKKAFKPDGFRYLKIQFNGCNESNDVPWNIAVDTVTIYMGSKTNPPTISAEDKFETYEKINSTKTTTGQPGNVPPAPPAGGDNTTSSTSKQDGGNKTTAGKNDKTTAGKNDNTTKAPVKTTTSINEKGEVITEAPVETTTSINENGEVVTEAPVETTTSINENGEVITEAPVETTAPAVDGETEDLPADGEGEKKPSALPYIIIGIVVVLAGAGVGVFFFLKKKKA
ncbi:MAG: hypothetical protein IIX28_05615 [Clostridia bacterium]|nr:hypothetical protein [Clostridia bacterium]